MEATGQMPAGGWQHLAAVDQEGFVGEEIAFFEDESDLGVKAPNSNESSPGRGRTLSSPEASNYHRDVIRTPSPEARYTMSGDHVGHSRQPSDTQVSVPPMPAAWVQQQLGHQQQLQPLDGMWQGDHSSWDHSQQCAWDGSMSQQVSFPPAPAHAAPQSCISSMPPPPAMPAPGWVASPVDFSSTLAAHPMPYDLGNGCGAVHGESRAYTNGNCLQLDGLLTAQLSNQGQSNALGTPAGSQDSGRDRPSLLGLESSDQPPRPQCSTPSYDNGGNGYALKLPQTGALLSNSHVNDDGHSPGMRSFTEVSFGDLPADGVPFRGELVVPHTECAEAEGGMAAAGMLQVPGWCTSSTTSTSSTALSGAVGSGDSSAVFSSTQGSYSGRDDGSCQAVDMMPPPPPVSYREHLRALGEQSLRGNRNEPTNRFPPQQSRPLPVAGASPYMMPPNPQMSQYPQYPLAVQSQSVVGLSAGPSGQWQPGPTLVPSQMGMPAAPPDQQLPQSGVPGTLPTLPSLPSLPQPPPPPPPPPPPATHPLQDHSGEYSVQQFGNYQNGIGAVSAIPSTRLSHGGSIEHASSMRSDQSSRDAPTADDLGDAPNIGSVRHHLRLCKPCAFVNTKGCKDGVECRFCHICESGEKKRRKKERSAIRRGTREFSGGCRGEMGDEDDWHEGSMVSA